MFGWVTGPLARDFDMIDRTDLFEFRDGILSELQSDAGRADMAAVRDFAENGGASGTALDLSGAFRSSEGDANTLVDIQLTEAKGLGVQIDFSNIMTIKPDGGTSSGKPDKGDGGGGGGGGKPGSGDGGDGGSGLLSGYVSSAVGSAYNIEIVFNGTNWTAELQDAFVAMADFLSSQVIGDLSNERVPFVGRIDDLKIDASIVTIDGEGGILGQAAPSSYRTSNNETPWLPASGIMEFDLADALSLLADGMFDEVVLHEMLHVMGVGTTWGADKLDMINYDTTDGLPRFTGAQANAEYLASPYSTGDTYAAEGIPIETDGGAGTAFGHWDELQLGDEIMTGYLNGSAMWSDITLAALDDMGYDTIYVA